MGFGYGCISLGSAALTADTQTERPSTRASRNVRMFFASERMLIIFAEEIRKISLKPYSLRRGGVRAEEGNQDIFEPFRINTADHATGMRNGYRSALF